MVLRKNLSKLLSQDESDEEEGETFDFVYRGNSEVDRHYTKPMLPWVISEIKNQHRIQQVSVTMKNGVFTVKDKNTSDFIMSHQINQIHKCVMEQADHRCFLYTLRPTSTQGSKGGMPNESELEEKQSLQPCNITADQNYQCHLYQALTEEEVRIFFSCLRQQPKEFKVKESDSLSSLNSLAELSVSVESQFFEVLFVGRVKVSHCKVPATFIDEALQAFRSRDKRRQRDTSDEGHSSPNHVMAFQQEGSGYSVPNIVLHNPGENDVAALTQTKEKNKVKGEFRKSTDAKPAKVRFHLGSMDDQDSRQASLSPQSSVAGSATSGLANNIKKLASFKHLSGQDVGSPERELSRAAHQSVVSDEPRDLLRRQRSISGNYDMNTSSTAASHPEPMQRGRTGSFGSVLARQHSLRPVESDLKGLRADFNRTMLFHIGYREIQLVNPELKSVQLNKSFKDIAGCCLGVKAADHFGFICKELSGNSIVYVSYIFRCEKSSVAEEIMQVLNRSFSAMHEAHEKERQEHLMCDFCPLKWLSHLCSEVEGFPAPKAHTIIMKRVAMLPEEERETIIAKYEGVESHDIAHRNNVLMMLLRTHFEYKQMNHSHPTDTCSKSDFSLSTNIESSLKRAKKSLTNSFSQLLKREETDRETSPSVEVRSGILRRSHSPDVPQPPAPTHNPLSKSSIPSWVLEGISDSPLRPHRPRSSTLTAVGSEAIRKEIQTKKAQQGQPLAEPLHIRTNGANKSPPPPPTLKKAETQEEVTLSFRHAILQKVVSPKGLKDSPKRRCPSLTELKPGVDQRDRRTLITLWKRVTFQIIMLNKIEKQTKIIRLIQKEAALVRVRLNYEEEDLPGEALQAWEVMLSRRDMPIDAHFLHSGIKQGIPKIVRGDIWNLVVSQEDKGLGTMSRPVTVPSNEKDKSSLYYISYEKVLKELTSQQHAILIDLGRTFPRHPYFTQTLGPGQLSLFNILKAYSIVDQEVGYCQGLGFIGGVILMHVDEENAYELLKHLMFEKGCRKQYRCDLDGLQIQMYQLSRLVRDNFIDLHDHLEENEITPQLYAAPWFLTIFASQFPMNFVVRVFDLLFLFGMETVFAVCLVLFRIHEQELLSLTNFEQIMHYFKNSVPLIDTNQLSQFFAEVCECNLTRCLMEYEVEYRVLQEEQIVSPQQLSDMKQLSEANQNLKRTNQDLLEQLHTINRKQSAYEISNQALQQSQHHLEVRVRWLELERNNMRHLINLFSKNASQDVLALVPSNLERYLPNKSSTPVSEDRRHVSFSNTIEVSTDKVQDCARPSSRSPALSREASPNYLRLPGAITTTRERANTLDDDSLKNYFKKITG